MAGAVWCLHPGMMRRNERGSVVWWVVGVMGCVLLLLTALGVLAQRSLRIAQAQAVADLSALAAVGSAEAGRQAGTVGSAPGAAQEVSARNGWVLTSVTSSELALGGRLWRVRISGDGVSAVAAARPDPVHRDLAAGP